MIRHVRPDTRRTAASVPTLRTVVCLAVVLLISSAGANAARAASRGPEDAHTNAPTFGGGVEPNFTACHSSFPVDSGPGRLSISAPATYEPDTIYEIRVLVSHTGRIRWGFELTAIDDSLIGAGELLAGSDGFSQVSLTGTREYVKQTASGTADDQADQQEWTFSWKAPPSDIGPIKLHAAGVAANSTSGASGDDVYTAVVTVPEPPMLSLQLAGYFAIAAIAAVRLQTNRSQSRSTSDSLG
jgi:hypothetical protein